MRYLAALSLLLTMCSPAPAIEANGDKVILTDDDRATLIEAGGTCKRDSI